MHSPEPNYDLLSTTVGDFPLNECCLQLNNRELKILHVAAMVTHSDESHFLLEMATPLPYGIALWSSTIALAHEIAARAAIVSGQKVLELGAGTGLPGIVAAAAGAKVVQTDKNNLAMRLCKRNCELNSIQDIEHRLADWTNWDNTDQYDLIVGSDILYATDMHQHLRCIFESNLAPEARILLSDPFRPGSLKLLEEMEKDGWKIAMTKWNIGKESETRPVAVFSLEPPARHESNKSSKI